MSPERKRIMKNTKTSDVSFGASMLIQGGHVVDPKNRIDGVCDILVEGAKIRKVEKTITQKAKKTIDAKGKIVMPGIVDMHVHLREPGREDKETIESATEAAIKGGVTSLLAMPNTDPAIDSPQAVKLLKKAIKKSAKASVFMAGAITKGRAGKEIVDITALKKEGVIALTDDGASVDDEEILLKALKEAARQGVALICHCEDKALSEGGSVNLGLTSTRMGLRGISKESEYKRIERDISLAKKAKAGIHIAHVSCKESVDIIRKAKKEKIQVTAETAPHYFMFSEEDVLRFDTSFKMNPPLRSREDVSAIKKGLSDGTIDAIASDHAPHTENEKDIEFERAEFGIIGLETELAAAITELCLSGTLKWNTLAEKFCTNPAKILGLKKGSLGAGDDADIIIVDPGIEWTFTKNEILSKSKNSPFIGKQLKGKVLQAICGGKIVI